MEDVEGIWKKIDKIQQNAVQSLYILARDMVVLK
jgi:hypothetical protein